MDHAIPHGAHEMPWDIIVPVCNFIGDQAGSLANDYKIHFHRTDGPVIFAESLKIHATGELLDLCNRIQNILNLIFLISRRHGRLPPRCAHEGEVSGFQSYLDPPGYLTTSQENPAG